MSLNENSKLPSSGGGGGSISVKEEGVVIAEAATSINFVGADLTAAASGGDVTVTLSDPTAEALLLNAMTTNSITHTSSQAGFIASPCRYYGLQITNASAGAQIRVYHNTSPSGTVLFDYTVPAAIPTAETKGLEFAGGLPFQVTVGLSFQLVSGTASVTHMVR